MFVVHSLRLFMPWADVDPEYGLAITYRWLSSLPRSGYEAVDDELSDDELTTFFRTEPTNPYRKRAITFISDCMLVLGDWINSRNAILERSVKHNENREDSCD